ncbi:polysaccharide deacetylase family protein [Sphingomonas sp. BT-65]|uniref:polysaccharide deacetylase family protein n=1 Tax=Sphingomonas sp. BT-65 TaxID=2989821 RepID=UPI0022360CDF|nr:polysaccharide deacetylase family protein [Sphingomonas sp. BT-65]MCW4463657.1 polysaccharide deacetylase family protein [Sphingomonas sp. BT-65]
MRWLVALLACLVAATPAAAQKRIALTFDDVPRNPGGFMTPDARAKLLVRALAKARVKQAAFFVTVGNLEKPETGDGAANIARYVRAGHVIANHSFAHSRLSGMAAADYLADIDRAEGWLKGRPGYRPWFRYPFLDEGGKDKAKRDAVREGLRARGLANGYVTAESSDWNIESLAAAAKKDGKRLDMAALRDLYVESHVEAAEFYDALAVKTLGRSPAHVMLLHETDIAAMFVDDLVKALRAKGWEIVTADAAFADPIRALRPDTPYAQGTLTEALAWEKGLPAPRWYERNDLKIATPLFRKRVLGEAE